MGQQQILLLILAVCIAGIAMSSFVITNDAEDDYRSMIQQDLEYLASQALEYYHRPFDRHGGEGTFIGLTATPQGFERLAHSMSRSYARYFISKSGTSRCVEVTAIGLFPGSDPRKPMKLVVTVFADRSVMAVAN